MEKKYPKYYEQLQNSMGKLGKELPGPMSGFQKLHEKAITEGALSPKTKELIALGISITVRCDGCIAYHVHDALKAGASRDEIIEVIGVAIFMGGAPSVVHGSEAYEAMEQFEAES